MTLMTSIFYSHALLYTHLKYGTLNREFFQPSYFLHLRSCYSIYLTIPLSYNILSTSYSSTYITNHLLLHISLYLHTIIPTLPLSDLLFLFPQPYQSTYASAPSSIRTLLHISTVNTTHYQIFFYLASFYSAIHYTVFKLYVLYFTSKHVGVASSVNEKNQFSVMIIIDIFSNIALPTVNIFTGIFGKRLMIKYTSRKY